MVLHTDHTLVQQGMSALVALHLGQFLLSPVLLFLALLERVEQASCGAICISLRTQVEHLFYAQ